MATKGKYKPSPRGRLTTLRNGATTTRHLTKNVTHIDHEEYDNLFRRLRYQLPRGLFHEATGTLAAFIESKTNGQCDFAAFKHLEDLPLAMCEDLDPKVLNQLDDEGVKFLKDLEKIDAEERLTRAGIGKRRRVNLEMAILNLKNRWWKWRARVKKAGNG